MKKYGFYFSIGLNVILLVYALLMYQSNALNRQDALFIDSVRKDSFTTLEKIIMNNGLNKTELLRIFKQSKIEYFDKDQSININFLQFEYDPSGKIIKIIPWENYDKTL